MDTFGKILLVTGGIIALAGAAFLLFGRLGLGKLPGDIVVRGKNFVFYFPIVTMIIVSLVLTLFFNLLRKLF